LPSLPAAPLSPHRRAQDLGHAKPRAVERINGLARFAPSVSGGRKLRIARFSRSVCFSSAAALSFAVNESGAILTKTVVLLTPEEVDEAVKKKVAFRAPGR
jgi:hypothetical protein